MINIRHPRLNEFAEKHFKIVADYFNGHKRKGFRDFIVDCDAFLQVHLLGFDFKKIILATPEELEGIVAQYDAVKDFDFSKIERLFDKFSAKDNGLDSCARQLVEDLEISVCPYCNRNFIYNTKEKRPSEIDHFHPKSKYPLLAMSFFNLVPSCKVCNQFKNSSKLEIVNPYDIRFDWSKLLRFRLKVTAADFYYNANSVELELVNLAEEDDVKQRVDNTIKVFELKDQYDHHRDYVLELIQKKYAYNEDYLNTLFKQYEGTLFRNREDLLRLVTSNFVDDKDLKNRPLAKLTKDISQQLDL